MPKKKGVSTNTFLGLGLVAAAVAVIFLVLRGQFANKPPPPPPPPPPAAPAQNITDLLREKPAYYKALIADDAKRFGTAPPMLSTLEQPAPFFDELATPRSLKARGATLETAHLRLRTFVKRLDAGAGQGFGFDHAILEITNRTERPLAYRVVTSVDRPDRCRLKAVLPHNAIALEPGETITRTECLYHSGLTVLVKRIEVVELPSALSYFYVSRLDPSQLRLDERTSAGHDLPGVKACQFVPWRDTEAASWADVIDFYARHNCDEYSFWRGYHRWTAPGNLPARAP